MAINDTRQRILTSDEFVISEAKKLQTLYKLKTEIRYGHERVVENHTESVAEHIYALHCLADYFLPLEDPQNELDGYKVHQMIQYHDIGEIETGDIVAHKKTEADYQQEIIAAKKVIARLPGTIQAEITSLVDDFELLASKEAKFARAVDKFEPLIHCFNATGRETLQNNKFTLQKRLDFTGNALDHLPIMKRFETVLDNLFVEEGYYFVGP